MDEQSVEVSGLGGGWGGCARAPSGRREGLCVWGALPPPGGPRPSGRVRGGAGGAAAPSPRRGMESGGAGPLRREWWGRAA